MKVADVGAGFGYFSFPTAEIVGEEGLVYAVEPDARRAREISKKADERGVKNIRVLVTGAEDLGAIAAGELDMAMSFSSFHHFVSQEKGLREMRRVVRPGGLVYIRDMERGRILKHGSAPAEFRRLLLGEFPDAGIADADGSIVAKVKV